MNEIDKIRLALLPTLAESAKFGHIGRTALMKYLYFLQTVREVPLEYSFSLYSYGPFDSDVLVDLGLAELLNIVEVSSVQFAGGYGYRIKAGTQAQSAKENAAHFLAAHKNDVEWLVSVFGNLNSAELELTSTIVYVDREFANRNQQCSLSDIATRVGEIKAHFTSRQIYDFAATLAKQGVLRLTTQCSTASC